MSLTLPASDVPDPRSAPSLGWGILGPGGIARSMGAALRAHTTQRIVAVGSRSLERASAYAAELGGRPVGSYAELVADPDVDVVYVATPHSEHREHALLAIEAGKHVLVEKAFTRNGGEAREVVEAARAKGVFLMEAMWSRFLPGWRIARRAVEEGLLGDVLTIQAEHGQLLWPDGPERMRDPALAAGALLDLGVYSLSVAAHVLPSISSVNAVGTLSENGVDVSESMTLRGRALPGGGSADVLASLTASMGAQGANGAVIAGTRARLEFAPWFYRPEALRLVGPDDELLDVFDPDDHVHGLHFEACEVARCVTDGRVESPIMPWSETLRVMGLMDEIRRQIGVTYPGE